jgi:hypothetical protein
VDLHYGGASFEVEFGSSHDAHLAARLAEYYLITDKDGNRYTILSHRMRHTDPEILNQPHIETFGGASNRSHILKLDETYEVPQRRGRGEFRSNNEKSSASSGPLGGPHDAPHPVNHPVSQTHAQTDWRDESRRTQSQEGWLEPPDSDCEEDVRICSQCTKAVDPQLWDMRIQQALLQRSLLGRVP